jgi:hypothetical protein
VRWGLRHTIVVHMGGMVLSLLLATLLVVGLQTGQAARQRLRDELQRTRKQFEDSRTSAIRASWPSVGC